MGTVNFKQKYNSKKNSRWERGFNKINVNFCMTVTLDQ